MDRIQIENLQIFAHHGVFHEENVLGQKFIVSARLYTDTHTAGMTDELTDSINYAEVCDIIERALTENTFKLIERAAEYTAREILLGCPLVRGVEITIKKPHAPVLKPLDFAAVTIKREWHRVYLGIGSNMGDKRAYLDSAVEAVRQNPLCRNVRVSEYIVTSPVGGVEQDDFLNGAIEADTLMTPHELLDFAHEVEQSAHRTREIHWGPRTLDIDILLYDDIIMHDEALTIPHIQMHKRAFALQPLSALNPYIIHPILGETVSQLAAKCEEI